MTLKFSSGKVTNLTTSVQYKYF